MPQITKTLIILNVAGFVLQLVSGNQLLVHFALWPLGPLFEPWQVVTYAFLHGSPAHLFFNMLGLFMFGSDMERVWGEKRYLTYYAVSVLSAAAAQLIVEAFTGIQAPTIGASGGVFGLLLAFAMYFPHRRVVLLFPPIPMPAWVFATVYGGIELFLGVTGAGGSVAHFAHLGGMAGGYVLIR
ncbi:MAG TPA: rhomboid family intramembrane serine protease, partial [Gammaproteobacteria bacterium]|nr:rhomboid family intramembrane serine protease [Gammaproteobacteria bacterium]